MKLHPHPRLYITRTAIARARRRPAFAPLRTCAAAVEACAAEALQSPVFEWELNTHNAHLLRARTMQGRVVTLITQWLRTREARFRDAAVAHILELGNWEYWSWITWRRQDNAPDAIYDLSYGENSATLAIAYDLLYQALTPAEKAAFEAIAAQRSFPSFLKHTAGGRDGGTRAWWMCHKYSNWNTVCAGGAGMLALAMAEALPEAATVLRRVEQSFKPYMATLRQFGGAWPEGIGYWNYGMRYAFMYLLSHQNATGRKHPAMQPGPIKSTMRFPLDFSPHGIGCSFGDVNRWLPLPFHYAVAMELQDREVTALLDDRLLRNPPPATQPPGGWPNAAEFLLLHPGRQARPPRTARNVQTFYKGQDWGILADQVPGSNLYLTIRGGTTEVPHGHRDLLSFHCVIGDEALIPSLGPGEYLDTTFSPRRWELPEMLPQTKNTILINGVGISGGSRVRTSPFQHRGVIGFHMDATAAMGSSRDGRVAKYCSRLICLVQGNAVLIVDRVILPHAGRVESRFHSFADVHIGNGWLKLKGQRQTATMAFASNVPASLHTAVQAPTTPGNGATILRWCSDHLHKDFILATLLTPGPSKPDLTLSRQAHSITLDIRTAAIHETLHVGKTLEPVSPESKKGKRVPAGGHLSA